MFGGKIPEPEVVSGLGINKGKGSVGWRFNGMHWFFWVRNFGVTDRSVGGLDFLSYPLFLQDLLYLKRCDVYGYPQKQEQRGTALTYGQRGLITYEHPLLSLFFSLRVQAGEGDSRRLSTETRWELWGESRATGREREMIGDQTYPFPTLG